MLAAVLQTVHLMLHPSDHLSLDTLKRLLQPSSDLGPSTLAHGGLQGGSCLAWVLLTALCIATPPDAFDEVSRVIAAL